MNTYESYINHIIFEVCIPSFLRGNKGGKFSTYLRHMVSMKFPKSSKSFLFQHKTLYLFDNTHSSISRGKHNSPTCGKIKLKVTLQIYLTNLYSIFVSEITIAINCMQCENLNKKLEVKLGLKSFIFVFSLSLFFLSEGNRVRSKKYNKMTSCISVHIFENVKSLLMTSPEQLTHYPSSFVLMAFCFTGDR